MSQRFWSSVWNNDRLHQQSGEHLQQYTSNMFNNCSAAKFRPPAKLQREWGSESLSISPAPGGDFDKWIDVVGAEEMHESKFNQTQRPMKRNSTNGPAIYHVSQIDERMQDYDEICIVQTCYLSIRRQTTKTPFFSPLSILFSRL